MSTPFFAEKNDSERKTISHRIFWTAAITLFLCPISAFAQCVTSWKGGAAGNWNVAGNWTAGVPSNNNTCISTVNSTVTLNIAGAAAANLTLGLSTDRLLFNNGTSLEVSGTTISNAGAISLNSIGNFTELIIGAPNVTLSGSGTVTMSNNANNYIFGAATADTLTNQETIQGAGHIGNGQMTLVNSGTINANQSAGLTIQANGGLTNTGTIEATGGTLLLNGTTVTNTGGKISDSGNKLQLINSMINGGAVTLTGASTLQLTNGIIHNGSTLTNSSTGTIEAFAGSSTLGGTITNPAGGVVKIDNAAVLNLENGSYPNLGLVTLNSTGNFTELVVAGANVTLSGGSVTMSNNANNYIFGAATADTLTNQETIQGAGHIGNGQMTLVNSGTINANQSAGLTIQANGGLTNTGTIEATGGTLLLNGTTVTNTGGKISDSGNKLQLINSTINGGAVTLTGASTLQLTNGIIHNGSTLTNSSTGTIEAFAGSSTLGGTITNPAGGVVKIDNAAVLNLENGSYPNLGLVTLNSAGNFTELVVAGANVTLSGGSVTMSNNANNYIFGAATADTLTNQETIQGAGHIGNGQMTLVNSGTINANQSAGLTIQANGGLTNTGTIEATGGTLLLNGTTVTNTGGKISDSGNKLQLINSTINGGAVTLTGASTLQLTNGIIHNGSTLTNSSTGTIEAFAGSSTLGGTITNPAGGVVKIDNAAVLNLENGSYPNLGLVTLNSTGNFTELVVAGANVTLSGGSVTMSNNANNYIFGAATADTLTNQETIQGAGHIGNGQMTLVNSGTINANQSAGLTIQANGGFKNQGTLRVSGGDLMHVESGPFTNFSGTTLTGGTYNVTGTLEIDQLGRTGGEIVTNAANIILNGTASSFVDAASKDALANLKTNGTGSGFTITGGRHFNTVGSFTNKGTLSVGSGSTFAVPAGFSLTNFSGTTLTGGTYNIAGALQFPGANIVTNAANITLTGVSGKILNSTTSTNGLAKFASNSAAGSFTINNGANFTTAGNFTNKGTLTIGSGSTTFTVGGAGNFTQTSGTTTADGKLTTAGAINIQGGTVFGNNGTLTGSFDLTGGALAPGDGLKNVGDLNITGTYTQGSSGALTIDLGGTIPNTKYDVLNITSTASLKGTLNVDLISGFTPAVGNTFNIINYRSETGTFTTLNLPTVTGDHWSVMYKATDVVLTLVAGAGPTVFDHAPLNLESSSVPTISTRKKQSAAALAVSTAEPSRIMMTDGTCGGLRTFTSFSCITKAISGVTNTAGMRPTQSEERASNARRDSVAIASTMRASGGGGASHTPSAPTISASRLYFCAYVPSDLARTMGCQVAGAASNSVAQPRKAASPSGMPPW